MRILTLCTVILAALLLAACDDPSPIGHSDTLPVAGLPAPTPTLFFLDTYGPLPEPSGPVVRTEFSYSDIAIGLDLAGVDSTGVQLSCVGPTDHWTQCGILLTDGRQMIAYVRGGAFVMDWR